LIHCAQPTTFTGRWYSPRDNGTYWRVWACADHLEGLVAIKELGWRKATEEIKKWAKVCGLTSVAVDHPPALVDFGDEGTGVGVAGLRHRGHGRG
jgi:hypothetical protein